MKLITFMLHILLLHGLSMLSCDANQTCLNAVLNIDDGKEILLTEKEIRILQLNYTLNVDPAENDSFILKICVTAKDPNIAKVHANDSNKEVFHLSNDHSRHFTFSVEGILVGRTQLFLTFVFTKINANESLFCVNQVDHLLVQSAESSFILTNVYPSESQTVVSFGKFYDLVVIRKIRAVDTAFNVVVIILVVLVNLGLGCTTELAVIKTTVRRPVAPITGFFSQFIIMPLVSFAAVKAFQFGPALALGFFALGCSPGGSASNAYTFLLDGDVSLSITMTFISTLAALGMLPLWFFTLGRELYSSSSVKIPYQNITYSLLALIIPVALGLLLKHRRPHWAKLLARGNKVLMGLFLLFVLTVGVYANLYIFQLLTIQVLLAAALMPYVGFILGAFTAFICRLSRSHILTIAIETGIQNTGIAIMLLLLSLDHPESDISIIAPITSSIFTPIPLIIAIIVLHIRKWHHRRSQAVHQLASDESGDEHDVKTVETADDVGCALPQELTNNRPTLERSSSIQ